MNESYPFVLPPLPYAYNALEPYMEEETVRVHHDTLFLGYVTRLNAALANYPKYQTWTLEKLIRDNCELPSAIQTTVFNNAGGVYNHTAYFAAMSPSYQTPSSFIASLINRSFGSYENFKTQMLAAGLGVFGSGWAWLVLDQSELLQIVMTKNQSTPLPWCLYPLLPLDVWEHAYFLQYLSARNEYINNWFSLINWSYVEQRILSKKYA